MAKYNIYGHVLYSEIEYEKLMYLSEKIFIQSLNDRVPSITKWIENIWLGIDHEYMIQTLEEIKRDIITQDYRMYLRYSDVLDDIERILQETNKIPNLYKINPIENFKLVESKYAQRISRIYKTRVAEIDDWDNTQYLTNVIKGFRDLEKTIVYKNGMRVTPATYLSMLYNVNLTRTGWNQTFKDSDYFERDLLLLETHPRSCPHCAPMQGKIYSKSGKRYPKPEVAYENGVGHPNCKCEWSILWDMDQLKTQYLSETRGDEYEIDQKKKATEREIRRAENDLNLYQMIGNGEMVDKTLMKIERLNEKLG